MNKSIYVQRLDIIQSEIDKKILKPNGFKKKGRTHNRTTEDHLVQAISFQIGQSYRGDNDFFTVPIGIRVPESFERTFLSDTNTRAFYQEYYCNIRTVLNEPLGHAAFNHKGTRYNAKCFSLCNDNYLPIINEITDKIENYVFPMFFDLETREKVIENRLKYWEKYKEFELANSFVYSLETAMIYGYFGDVDKAALFIQKAYDSTSHPGSQNYSKELSVKLGIILNSVE